MSLALTKKDENVIPAPFCHSCESRNPEDKKTGFRVKHGMTNEGDFQVKKFIPLFFFVVSFAYIESAVVVYLRELYYPEGFKFPLKLIPYRIGLIEVGREAATMVMIVVIGLVSGKTIWQRFSYSIFVFGIWDIFYYVWLKVFLDWPESLLTWDILFLIPVPWTAPVLAPIIIAFSITIAAIVTVYLEEKGRPLALNKREIVPIAIGALIILLSFMWDFRLALNGGIPNKYRWELFICGLLIGIGAFIKTIKNIRR